MTNTEILKTLKELSDKGMTVSVWTSEKPEPFAYGIGRTKREYYTMDLRHYHINIYRDTPVAEIQEEIQKANEYLDEREKLEKPANELHGMLLEEFGRGIYG